MPSAVRSEAAAALGSFHLCRSQAGGFVDTSDLNGTGGLVSDLPQLQWQSNFKWLSHRLHEPPSG